MRIAVMASGSGTLFDAIAASGLEITVAVVDRPCGAQEVADRHGVPCVLHGRDDFGETFDRVAYSVELGELLNQHGVELIVMAGFGTVLSAEFFDKFASQVLNTHPALLPSFPGWHAVRDALAYGVKVTGCTVHLATPEVDAGPILAQRCVAVLDGDDEATLHERIKTVERQLYVETIRLVLDHPELLKGS